MVTGTIATVTTLSIREMKACFIGLGYIGLPTAIVVASEGIDVIGVDINPSIVEKTNRGELHILEPGLDDMLREVTSSGKLKASTQPETSDVYFIVVPTPFRGDDREPDVSFVEAATRSVIPLLKEGDLFIIESTSPVGTTEAMARLIFEERPELEGAIYIAYCPERVLPGNVIHELKHNDRIIGGIDQASRERAMSFYSLFVRGTLHPTNAPTAELCKLVENASRDVQIAFANELALIADRAGVDVWELITLANKHPRVQILQPGCGVGGHCIAVDPYFITSSFPSESSLIARAREVNSYKPLWCLEKIRSEALRFRLDRGRLPVVALMGLAFKPNIDDLRESPAVQIVEGLLSGDKEAEYLIVEPNIEAHPRYVLTPLAEAYERADIVVFLVAHTPFLSLSKRSEARVLDFCGVTR